MRKEHRLGHFHFSKFFAQPAHLAPVFGVLGILLVCLDFDLSPPNPEGAFLLSRPLYGAFLFIALVALWLPSSQTRSRPLKVEPSAWWWADVMLCTYTLVPIMQSLIPLPRPPGSPIDNLMGVPIGGWPSGHQVSMFAMAWVLMVARPRLAWPAFALAIAMGWARLESNAHYPFQVISGGAFGMALGWWTTHHQNGFLLPRALKLLDFVGRGRGKSSNLQ